MRAFVVIAVGLLVGLGVATTLLLREPAQSGSAPHASGKPDSQGTKAAAFVRPELDDLPGDARGTTLDAPAVHQTHQRTVDSAIYAPRSADSVVAEERAPDAPDTLTAPSVTVPDAGVVHWPAPDGGPTADSQWRRFMNVRRARPDDVGLLKEGLERATAEEHWDDALWCASRLIELVPDDAEDRFARGSLNMRRRAWVDAIDDLELVVAADEANPVAWYNLAVARQALGQLAGARRAWDRVIALRPEDADALAHRGELLLDLHEWAEARADFEASLALAPDTPDGPGVRLNLSLALWRDGELAAALDAVQGLLETHTNHCPALNRAAEIAWDLHLAGPIGSTRFAERAAEFARRSLAAAEIQPDVRERLRLYEAEITRLRGD